MLLNSRKSQRMDEIEGYCYGGEVIGHGAFAVVYKGRHKETNREVAIKAIAKKNLSKAKNLLTKEIKILQELKSLQHDNLVSLLRCVETNTHVYLVMEYCNHGDLAEYLFGKQTLAETVIQHFFSQIAKALKALNAKSIVHRDLKPQNILLCNPRHPLTPLPTQLMVKLADFGFARFLPDGNMAGTLCGSPMYMAPEVIMSHQYGAKADLWSVGTIIYQCLTGKAPFVAQTPQALKSYYERHTELKPNIPNFCSSLLANLLLALLKRNPVDRIEFDAFFTHPFFTSELSEGSPSRHVLRPHSSELYCQKIGKFPTNQTIMTNGENSPIAAGLQKPQQCHPLANQRTGSTEPHKHLPLASKANYAPSALRRQVQLTGNITPLPTFDRPQTAVPLLTMNDSNEFTFLPPLHEIRHSQQQSQSRTNSQQNLQHLVDSSASSSNTHIKSIQVNSNTLRPNNLTPLNVNPVPVPNQRHAFALMEERRNAAHNVATNQLDKQEKQQESANVTDFSSNEQRHVDIKGQIAHIPSVEEIDVPETRFIVYEQPKQFTDLHVRRPRRNTTTDFVNDEQPSTSSTQSACLIHGQRQQNFVNNPTPTISPISQATIPKSATCALPLSQISEQEIEKIPIPAQEKRPELDNIRFLNASPSTMSVTENVIYKNGKMTMFSPHCAQESDDEEEEQYMEDPIQLPFATADEFMDVSGVISQMMESVGVDVATVNCDKSKQQKNSQQIEMKPSTSSESNNNPNVEGIAVGAIYHDDTHQLLDDAPEPPPELEQETLLEAGHRQTLSKLRFVIELIEAIVCVAENKSNPIAIAMESSSKRKSKQPSSDAYRRAEQLVLYIRALHILSSALVMAQKQINADTLHPSPAVQNVLNQLNEKYHNCLARSQELVSLGIPGQDPQTMVVSAERIMYQHAIDLCQSAALDELFGKPHLCPKRYQMAHMMLHTLLYTVQSEQDKIILQKYKNAVEKRLRILERQGLVTSVMNDKTFLRESDPV